MKVCWGWRILKYIFILSVFHLLLFDLVQSKKLSFKESLTIYSDSGITESGNTENHGKSKYSPNLGSKPNVFSSTLNTGKQLDLKQDKTTASYQTFNLQQKDQLPLLWRLVKNRFLPPQQKDPKIITKESLENGENHYDGMRLPLTVSKEGAHITKETLQPQQTQHHFLTTMKNEVQNIMEKSSNTTSVHFNTTENGKSNVLHDEEVQQQQRSKKDARTSPLQDLLWSTAKALWAVSVNKEHFLPTFLHTKTGGKLSLIRDSIFKPVAILSQYRRGVTEINNEKWKNLDSGWWSNPNSQVFVVKYQPEHSLFLTLARYVFRLTKHTVITKWRLKRALLDLQFRALRKLARIISSRSIRQKLATIRILTNAILKGKLAFLRSFRNSSKATTDTYYQGKDNSLNVDITYSPPSVKPYSSSGWTNNAALSDNILTPPSPNSYSQYDLKVNNGNTGYNPIPPQIAYVIPEPLIETPSYAQLLKTMGINPTSYKQDVVKDVSEQSVIDTPHPTVVYYSSVDLDTNQHLYENSQKESVIEKPATSFSYHISHPQNQTSFSFAILNSAKQQQDDVHNKQYSFKTVASTESPFRFKLLEAMSGTSPINL